MIIHRRPLLSAGKRIAKYRTSSTKTLKAGSQFFDDRPEKNCFVNKWQAKQWILNCHKFLSELDNVTTVASYIVRHLNAFSTYFRKISNAVNSTLYKILLHLIGEILLACHYGRVSVSPTIFSSANYSYD